ncbi:MAG TPA: 3'-5' exonuclease [Prolixibacteraceae bacterium]|mgnify:FL=1|nr:3'-5' exonuclease [Prolixibacteraceae bacterium]
MFDQISSEDILFIDIETVPQQEDFTKLSEQFQKLWEKKSSFFRSEEQNAADVYERAGIYAEFGRIICISAGVIIQKNGERYYRVKSFHDTDEKKLISGFNDMLDKFTSNTAKKLCAHNGLEFDYPYIARRALINGLKLPKILDVAGAKPWEIKDRLLDTLQMWKFGDYKSYTSLDLLCAVFGIPTPKDDIDGSMVSQVYYKEGDIDRIIRYCEKDTLALANLFLKYKGEPIILAENMLVV